MEKYLVFNKKVGQTPLQVIEGFKEKHPEYQDVPMSYAGRLDPMASGKLLVLVGDECKRQEKYHALDKEYEFEVLFGVKSDTGDVLGIVKESSDTPRIEEKELKNLEKTLKGSITLPYPVYSSKTVRGKPLFEWALESRLNEITTPSFTSKIYDFRYHGIRKMSQHDLKTEVFRNINLLPTVTDERKVLGKDFRRDLVDQSWKNIEGSYFFVARFSCITSSGLYIRSLAPHIGEVFNMPALALSIHRKNIGTYFPSLHFWLRKY